MEKLSLRLRVFLFFCLMGLGCIAIIAGSLYFAASRLDPGNPGSGFATAAILAGFLCVGLILFVWRLFDEHVAQAIERLAAELRAHAHSDVSRGIDAQPARYLGDLAPAAGAVAGSLAQRKSEVEETVVRQTANLEEQKAQLTALLSDIQAGLILCTPGHKVVFYNVPAVELLRDTGRPRLDRSIFDLLREAPIRQTFKRLLDDDDLDHADVLVSTTGCGRSIAGYMRLVSGALGLGETPGYVLTLRDVTADLESHMKRDRMLRETIDAVRDPAARLGHYLERDHDALSDVAPGLVLDLETLTGRVNEAITRRDNDDTTWWPMQNVRAAHVIDSLRGQLGDNFPTLSAPVPNIKLRCDGFAIAGLLAGLLRLVFEKGLAEAFAVEIERVGPGAVILITWNGEPLREPDLVAFLSQAIPDGPLNLTGREALDHHATDIRLEHAPPKGQHALLPIKHATDASTGPDRTGLDAERPAVFDFDLLNQGRDASKHGKRLQELTFVVFDTETTGLEPRTDEIVQIAAVRLMNGKRIKGEAIDQLVDPERPIPQKSTEVHGISDDMVRSAPKIREAGAEFHRFCENAVLVAHNAPFDMAFFHRHAAEIGAEFDHPVFDTVLLSALLFGQDQTHTLDALAERFGVVIPEKDRHTALGDTVATAEVFQRMIPMLEAKGLDTFDAVLNEMVRNSKLLREMNARVR